MSKFHRGVLYLGISVVLYSIMPVLIRFLGAGSLPPAAQVFLRYVVAFFCAGIYFWRTSERFIMKRSEIALLFIVSLFGYALTNLFYTYAILLTQVGTVLFIFFSFSVLTPIFAQVFLGETITKEKLVAILLGAVALLFLFRPGPIDTWKSGAWFAVLSAIGQAVYVIGRKKLSSIGSPKLLLTNTFLGVVAVGLISITTESSFYAPGGIGSVTPGTWFLTLLFGIDNFAAWLFMTRGFQLVSAGTGSLVMLSENFIGIVFAFLFFREIPSFPTAIGGICVLAASLLVIRSEHKT